MTCQKSVPDTFLSLLQRSDARRPATRRRACYVSSMREYQRNRWLQIGLALVVFGWGPLAAIILLAAVGLWPDPNPNPIGPGLLFFFTFWPAVICLAIGLIQARFGRG